MIKDLAKIFIQDRWINTNQFLDDLEGYLEWLEVNKLKEAKLYGSEGDVAQLDRMRVPSMQGFQFYLRCTKATIDRYRALSPDWAEAFSFVEETFYALSFEGAAAGLLKESIVMRKLGMADKVEQVNTQKRVVILHTPDNGRSFIEAEQTELLEEGYSRSYQIDQDESSIENISLPIPADK